MRALRIAGILLACGLMANCASITTGTEQQVTVVTDPPGALCQLHRDGGVVGVVNPTPGSTRISKSKSDINVVCTKTEHQEAKLVLESGLQGLMAGNIIFGLLGGGIGIIVDAASGAANEYPESIMLFLPPDRFLTEAERDRFFARVRAHKETAWNEKIETAERSALCTDPNRAETCRIDLERLAKQRDDDLAALDEERKATPFGAGA